MTGTGAVLCDVDGCGHRHDDHRPNGTCKLCRCQNYLDLTPADPDDLDEGPGADDDATVPLP